MTATDEKYDTKTIKVNTEYIKGTAIEETGEDESCGKEI